MKTKLLNLLLLGALLLPKQILAQVESALSASYIKSNEKVTLTIALLNDDDDSPIIGAPITVYNIVDGDSIALAQLTTNKAGKGKVENIDPAKIKIDSESKKIVLLASFAGNDDFSASSKKLKLQNTFLDIHFVDDDGVKKVAVKLTRLDEEGNIVPFPEEDVYIYVQRFFGMLKIAEAWTSEDGTDQVKIPMDLPGDKDGVLVIEARHEGGRKYGNVYAYKSIDWGIPLKIVQASNRELWTPNAPTWMLITFIILMTGVWGHYLIILINLILIKKEGNKINKNKNPEIQFE